MDIQQTKKSFLYEIGANMITNLVGQGTLRPGDRMPSIRKMRFQQRVSISTVMKAYYLLENRGLVEARPQSGFYIRLSPLAYPPDSPRHIPLCIAIRLPLDSRVVHSYLMEL